MNKFNYELNSSDVETILLGLSVLPMLDFDLSNAQQAINDSLCKSCFNKLTNGESDFNINEIRIISCALDAMDEIIRDEFDIEPEIAMECKKHLFTINKLMPVFENMLPSE